MYNLAQLFCHLSSAVELYICNVRVGGSNPSDGSKIKLPMKQIHYTSLTTILVLNALIYSLFLNNWNTPASAPALIIIYLILLSILAYQRKKHYQLVFNIILIGIEIIYRFSNNNALERWYNW